MPLMTFVRYALTIGCAGWVARDALPVAARRLSVRGSRRFAEMVQ